MATLYLMLTVKFSGTTAQVIGGSNATTFNHLTITNSTARFQPQSQ
jgi:hypothetical protein